MLAIADKLVIAFLYISILVPKLTVYSAPMNKVLIGLGLYFFSVHALAARAKYGSKRTTIYVLVCFILILGLSTISLFKGNEFENIFEFISPLLILLTIPMLSCLFSTYGPMRYLLHLEAVVSLLAVYVIGLYLLCGPLEMRELGLVIGEVTGSTSISFPDGTVRVGVVTGGFYASGLVLATYFLAHGGTLLHAINLALIGSAVYLSHTMGLWMGSAFAVIGYVMLSAPSRARAAALLAFVVGAVVAIGVLFNTDTIATPEEILLRKEASLSQKQLQAEEGLALFSDKPLLGYGVGYLFRDTMVPNLSTSTDIFLEVSYVMLLAATGLVGLICYGFIYGYYPVHAILKFRTTSLTMPLVLSHASVLIAAWGNPYMWSGGGLLFVVLIASMLDSSEKGKRLRLMHLRAA